MEKIEQILYSNSHDTADGLEIDFNKVYGVIRELKGLTRNKVKEGCLHMLNYCFENVGNDKVNIEKELEKWMNENIQ